MSRLPHYSNTRLPNPRSGLAAVREAALLLAIDVVARGTGVGHRSARVDHGVLVLRLRGLVGGEPRVAQSLGKLRPVGAGDRRGHTVRAHAARNGEEVGRFGEGQRRTLD